MNKQYRVVHAGKELVVSEAYKNQYEGEIEVLGVMEDGEFKELKNKKAKTPPPPSPK